jgi:hypothetical protein
MFRRRGLVPRLKRVYAAAGNLQRYIRQKIVSSARREDSKFSGSTISDARHIWLSVTTVLKQMMVGSL